MDDVVKRDQIGMAMLAAWLNVRVDQIPPEKQRRHDSRKLGKFGAASPVRRIDPKTGEVIEEAPMK